MYDRVLVATDGGPAGTAAVEHGADLAARHDATVHVLYVVDTRGSRVVPDARSYVVHDELLSGGEHVVGEAAAVVEERGAPVETAVQSGVPHREIVAYAAAIDADLVVMGTHGRTGVRRLLLGSTTEAVVRRVDVPVLVEHPPADGS